MKLPIVLLLFAQPLLAQIIPAPVKLEKRDGHYSITNNTTIATFRNREIENVANYFINRFRAASGFNLQKVESSPAGMVLRLNEKKNPILGTEGYTLEVTASGVLIQANTPVGLFYGIQSLLQLLPPAIESKTTQPGITWTVPFVSVLDYPRFAWRGLMLDVSRHFFSKEYVKQYIDRMARYKFNRFHWHLTDDNGWRIEIKKYPKLTTAGAWRVPRTGTFNDNTPPKSGEKATYGGYYTQEEIKEVVQYARERFIEILPEVDVPGHSMAALVAYPELSITMDTTLRVDPGTAFATWYDNGTFEMHVDNTLNPTDEKVYQFLEGVFGEMANLFPFEYIHMGGDECYKGYWLKDERVKEFMRKNKIADGMELQAYFNKRVNAIIRSKNKKMIGWDEILEGGKVEGAAVMSWRGTKGGAEATQHKHPVVMSPSPQYYLDFMQGESSIEAPVYNTTRLKDVYSFDILAPGIDSAFVLGGQGNLWTEQIPTTAQAEYQTYPRAWALVESLWSPRSKKQWNDFTNRVENQFQRLDVAGVNYSPSLYDPIISVSRNTFGQLVVTLAAEAENLDFYYTMDNAIPNQYHTVYKEPVVLPEDVDYFKVVSYRTGKPLGRLISLKKEELESRVGK